MRRTKRRIREKNEEVRAKEEETAEEGMMASLKKAEPYHSSLLSVSSFSFPSSS